MLIITRTVTRFLCAILACVAILTSSGLNAYGIPLVKNQDVLLAAAQSPTLTFLSDQELLQAVRTRFGRQVEQHKQHLINPALQREIRYGKTHVPFYHGQNIVHRVYQDILGAVYRALGNQLPDDFVFLRFWRDAIEQKTANEFIDAYEGGNYIFQWYDGERALAKNILSTTYSLFGNVTNGSCAFDYYAMNNNNVSYSLEDLLQALFGHYGFEKAYIKKFERAHELLRAKAGGSICQIFIPKAIVDNCVYISQPGGTPQRYEIDGIKGFDNNKKRYTQISPFLRYHCAHPSQIMRFIEGTQARIVFVPEMLDFSSDVKIFRYAQIEPEVLKTYQETITQLCAQMVQEYKQKATRGK